MTTSPIIGSDREHPNGKHSCHVVEDLATTWLCRRRRSYPARLAICPKRFVARSPRRENHLAASVISHAGSELAPDLLMRDVLKSIYPWVVFAGSVLIVAVLYWAQVVLVPVALAGLLTFFLTPVVTRLQRWLGRVPAVLTVTIAAVALLGLVGWGLSWQVASVLDELPAYRENIRQRVREIQGASRGGSVEKLQTTVDDIQKEINKQGHAPAGHRPCAGGGEARDGARIVDPLHQYPPWPCRHRRVHRGSYHLHASRASGPAKPHHERLRSRTPSADDPGSRRGG